MDGTNDAEQNGSTESSGVEYYLPAMPRPSSGQGRVERFLRTLFRRRGRNRVVVRRTGR